jgi:hypothetical protein
MRRNPKSIGRESRRPKMKLGRNPMEDVTWMNLNFSGDNFSQLTALVCMVRLARFEPATCLSGG